MATTAGHTRRTYAERRASSVRAPRSVVLKRRIRLAIVVLLALLFAVVGTGVFASYNLYRAAEDHYVRVALPLASTTKDLLFQIELEETGSRGYIITSERSSLQPY